MIKNFDIKIMFNNFSTLRSRKGESAMNSTDFIHFLRGPLEMQISKTNAMELFMEIDDNHNGVLE